MINNQSRQPWPTCLFISSCLSGMLGLGISWMLKSPDAHVILFLLIGYALGLIAAGLGWWYGRPWLAWSGGMVMVGITVMGLFSTKLSGLPEAWKLSKFACQLSLPLLCLTLLYHYRALVMPLALVSISLCFTLHGMADLNILATPGEYYTTSQLVLGWERDGIRTFLQIVGIMDVCIAVAIWWRPLRIPALALATLWGSCTIAARIIAYGHSDIITGITQPWFYESLFRLPHMLVPLGTLLLAWSPRPGQPTARTAATPLVIHLPQTAP